MLIFVYKKILYIFGAGEVTHRKVVQIEVTVTKQNKVPQVVSFSQYI